MIANINTTEAEKFIAEGFEVRRSSWEPCRSIRNARLGDYDYISNFDLDNVIVEDCKKECDCMVGIYQQTPEDKNATDWEVIDSDDWKLIEGKADSEPAVERSVATKV